VSELRQSLISEFGDTDYRYAYAESFLNTKIATQIRTLREQRNKKQVDVGAAIGTKQSGYSRFEDVNHSVWKTDTLWKIAKALDVRLNISFETFGSLIDEKERFNRESLQRPDFKNDPAFNAVEPADNASVYLKDVLDDIIKSMATVALPGGNPELAKWYPEVLAGACSDPPGPDLQRKAGAYMIDRTFYHAPQPSRSATEQLIAATAAKGQPNPGSLGITDAHATAGFGSDAGPFDGLVSQKVVTINTGRTHRSPQRIRRYRKAS